MGLPGEVETVHGPKLLIGSPWIVEADSGEVALDILRASLGGGATPFQLAFLDEHYTKASSSDGTASLTGTAVASEYRKLELRAGSARGPGKRRLVIVGVTGNAGQLDYTEDSLAAGMDAVWGKPLPSVDEMRRQLASLCAL